MARLTRRRSVIDQADEQISIITAARLIGMDLPGDLGPNIKIHCPFGAIWHSDHGLDATMRVYLDGNHVHCFSRCGHFSPVGLVATAWGITRRAAAIELLERAGRRPLSLAAAWAQAGEVDEQPDRLALGEALKTFCARTVPDWADVQFEPSVAHRLTRCLALLDLVCTPDDAKLWLSGCKKAMTTGLAHAQEPSQLMGT